MFTNPQWFSPIREWLSLGIPASPHHRFSTLSVKFLCFFVKVAVPHGNPLRVSLSH